MILIRRLWLSLATGTTLVLLYFLYSGRSSEKLVDYSADYLRITAERYPVESYIPLPTGIALSVPRIQHDFSNQVESERQKQTRRLRQSAVKSAFEHSWTGYKTYAYGHDEVTPLSGGYLDSFGGWGASLVDAMDTLWILGMKKDFEEGVQVISQIDFTRNTETVLNTFETTIRYLGGFLAAYDLSDHAYPSLLSKAVELADILMMSFDTPNRLPLTRWQWRVSARGHPLKAADRVLLAELGSLNLEFTRLAQLTHEVRYFDAVERISRLLQKYQDLTKLPGLWPTIINAEQIKFDTNHFTFGGMADSAYEYLPKEFMLLGGSDEKYRIMYSKAMAVAKKHIFYRPLVPNDPDILLSGNAALDEDGKVVTESQGQHLTCFAAGMVGLAAKIFTIAEDLDVARRLVDGCIWAYNSTATGLMPETFHVASCHSGSDGGSKECRYTLESWYKAVAETRADDDKRDIGSTATEIGAFLAEERSLLPGYTTWGDNRYILRPEAIESIFIMYRITGDSRYPEIAWKMFKSIGAACRTSIAYAAISDVRTVPAVQQHRMESFWLAETLKYFYLIFSDPAEISLDEWVLNTEAHPLRRPRPGDVLFPVIPDVV